MICKNCGKEINDSIGICTSCGANTGNQFMSNTETATAVVSTKKKPPTKPVIGAIIAVVVIILITFIGLLTSFILFADDNEVFKSNSPSGASFNCTMDDVIKRYNRNIDKHLKNDGLSDEEYEAIKNQFKMDASYFIKESDGKYFVSTSNNSYGITVFTDDSDNVYGVEFVCRTDVFLDSANSDTLMLLIRGLFNAVEPSKSYDEIKDIVANTADKGVIQKDNVKHVVTYETNNIRFASMAMFDE